MRKGTLKLLFDELEGIKMILSENHGLTPDLLEYYELRQLELSNIIDRGLNLKCFTEFKDDAKFHKVV